MKTKRIHRVIPATVILMTVSIAQCYGADPELTAVDILCNENSTLTVSATAEHPQGILSSILISAVSYDSEQDCLDTSNATGQINLPTCTYNPVVEGPVTCQSTVACETGTGTWYRGAALATDPLGGLDMAYSDTCCQCTEAQPVPSLTEWGIVALVLIVLAAGAVTIVRKRQTLMV